MNKQLFGGTESHNDLGSFLFIETIYHPEDLPGPEFSFEIDPTILLPDRDIMPAMENLLYIDTETTGIYENSKAFLIGTGFFEQNKFRLQQFFMRGEHEEQAMNKAFVKLASKASGFVSFNGISFDLPLLQRQIGHMFYPLDLLPHIDLLPLSRKIWKGCFENCRLQTLEKHVLCLQDRQDDIPANIIPQCYEQYRMEGITGPIVNILNHNRQDILSLVGLLGCVYRSFQGNFSHRPNHVLLGKHFLKNQNQALAVKCLYEGLDSNLPQALECAKTLSKIHRENQHYDEIITIWQTIIKQWGYASPLPFIEISKCYEYKKQDYKAALDILSKLITNKERAEAALESRITRLQQKLEKTNE